MGGRSHGREEPLSRRCTPMFGEFASVGSVAPSCPAVTLSPSSSSCLLFIVIVSVVYPYVASRFLLFTFLPPSAFRPSLIVTVRSLKPHPPTMSMIVAPRCCVR